MLRCVVRCKCQKCKNHLLALCIVASLLFKYASVSAPTSVPNLHRSPKNADSDKLKTMRTCYTGIFFYHFNFCSCDRIISLHSKISGVFLRPAMYRPTWPRNAGQQMLVETFPSTTNQNQPSLRHLFIWPFHFLGLKDKRAARSSRNRGQKGLVTFLSTQ